MLPSLFFLEVEEAADAVERARFAKDDQAFEQRRRGGAAGEDGAQQHEVFLDGPLLLFAEFLGARVRGLRG